MIRKVLFRTTRAVKQGSDCVTFRRETAYKERASRGYALPAEQTFVLLTRGEKSSCCSYAIYRKKQSSFMASCGYAALVGGHCGCSAGNPANSQCVTIAHCNKDIQGHLRSFGAGMADSSIKNEVELLLSRAGKKRSVMYLFIPNWVNNFSGVYRDRIPGRIQEGPAPQPPLFLNQTRARRGHKCFFGDRASPLSLV